MIHTKTIEVQFSNIKSPPDVKSTQHRTLPHDKGYTSKGITTNTNYNQFFPKDRFGDITIKDATPPKQTKNMERSFYPKNQNTEIFQDPSRRDDRLKTAIYNIEIHKIGSDTPENNRENRFKTINVRRENNSMLIDDKSKLVKMNTITPGDNLKTKVQNQLKKVFKRSEASRSKNDGNSQSRNMSRMKSKEPDQGIFPVIPQSKKTRDDRNEAILIEPSFSIGKHPKELSSNGFNLKPTEMDKRNKSSIRHASVLRGRAPAEPNRRAFSHQRSSKQKMEDYNKVMRGRPLPEDLPGMQSNSSVEGIKATPTPIIISLADNRVINPQPPKVERSANIPARSVSQRPGQNGHLKERNPNLKVNTLTRTFLEGDNFSSYQTNLSEEREKNISHYKTQPHLDENQVNQQQYLQVPNNKSIDDGLRRTVDSQNEISYPVKIFREEKSSNEISSTFAVSPSAEKRGRFVRKIKDKIMKREESSKNILDDVEDRAEKLGSTEHIGTSPTKHDRSKSPFDDLLETSLMCYEKDSIARLRNQKEIEMTVSMTKNANFKRSKVIVSKGNFASDQMASTNVTNSKSTYKNESIQSNIKDESSVANADSGKKPDHMDYDFAFDDESTKKKSSNEPKGQKKNNFPLNVIDEADLPEDPTLSPSSKKTTITPLFMYAGGHKMSKNQRPNYSRNKGDAFEDDDICINGENSDMDVVNSMRAGLDASPGPLTDSVNMHNPLAGHLDD